MSSAPIVTPIFNRLSDVFALSALYATTQKHHERLTVLSKIHAIAWARSNTKFGNAIAYWLAVAGIP
jgi:hypothetical protein